MSLHLQAGIAGMKQRLSEEAALIVQRLNRVIAAILARDTATLRNVAQDDAAMSQMESEFEQQCLDLLLLRGPLAADFRFIVTCIRVNAELEAIDDVIVSIARRAESLTEPPAIPCPFDLKQMSNVIVEMLQTAVQSVVRCDDALANTILIQQEKADACQRHAMQMIESLAPRLPSLMRRLLQLLSLAQRLEQIARAAVRIEDEAIYLVNGRVGRCLSSATGDPPKRIVPAI